MRQLLALSCLVVALGLVPEAARATAGLDGGLTQIGCVDVTAGGCEGTMAPGSLASEIIPSPDGNDLYVLADMNIYDVRRASDGTMTLGQCWTSPRSMTGCAAETMIDGSIRQLAFSPDGRFAYLATDDLGSPSLNQYASLTVFARDPASGVLSTIQCIGPQPTIPCPDATPTHADGVQEVALSSDGRYVDVFAGRTSDQQAFVSSFVRAPDGTLSETGCLAAKATSGCGTSPALGYPAALLESTDGTHVYAVGEGTIVSLARDAAGTLHEIGCLSAFATADASCQVVAGADGIENAVLAPDGKAAYAFDQLGLWNLRIAAGGTLEDAGCGLHGHIAPCVPAGSDGFTPSFLAIDDAMLYAPAGGAYALYHDDSASGRTAGPGMGTSAVAASRGVVYYFSNGSLFAFARVPPTAPICLAVAATITRPSGTIDVQCTDPRGEPLTFGVDSPPAHGTVATTAASIYGAIQLRYVPAAGSATSDSFTFHVDDGLATSAASTVKVAIARSSTAPPAKGGGGKVRARVALTLGSARTLRVRRGAATLTFRCGRIRCTGTVALLRRGHTVLRARFSSDRTGHVRATLRLPRSLRPSVSQLVHLRLRVIASAKGFRPRTVARAISLAAAG